MQDKTQINHISVWCENNPTSYQKVNDFVLFLFYSIYKIYKYNVLNESSEPSYFGGINHFHMISFH